MEPLQLAQLDVTSPVAGDTGGRMPGLYVHVIDGMIHLTNKGGTQNFAAGQFGYASSLFLPPVILPRNPGMQFMPPPVFNMVGTAQAGTVNREPGAVDCEVR